MVSELGLIRHLFRAEFTYNTIPVSICVLIAHSQDKVSSSTVHHVHLFIDDTQL